jgi:salicylate hydroxylase
MMGTAEAMTRVKGACSMYTRARGAQGCHSAHFLDECVKLIPKNVTHFRKQLDTVVDQGEKDLVLQFSDGSSAAADAVVGCDGIRSRVRQLILGEDNPEILSTATYMLTAACFHGQSL